MFLHGQITQHLSRMTMKFSSRRTLAHPVKLDVVKGVCFLIDTFSIHGDAQLDLQWTAIIHDPADFR